jgi:hypothetical protein
VWHSGMAGLGTKSPHRQSVRFRPVLGSIATSAPLP